jgi:acetyltransferase
MSDDATFGPVILFGEGGTAVEIVADKAIGLPPLNDVLARDLIGRTKVMRKLRGYRDVPAADIDGVIGVLIAISQLVADMPAIAELDINPLIASDKGVMALDARIRIHGAAETRDDRLAISPYPAGLSGQISARNGADYSLRPIRPEDEPDLIAMVEQLDPEDARLRFMSSMRRMSHRLAARLTQIDYDREMAFIALDDAGIAGVVRLTADPDNERAEYAVLVRSPLKGTGLGFALMQHIIDHARARGIKTLFGHVLKENHAMLSLAAELGFMTEPVEGESDQLRVVLDLRSP